MKTKARHIRRDYNDFYHDLDEIKDVITKVTSNVKGRAGEALSNTLQQMRDKRDTVEGYVSQNVSSRPFKSLSVAMLTGALIGYFLHR